MTKILHVDMDGVLCDIAKAYRWVYENRPEVEFPQSVPGLFENLDPIDGAIDAVATLRSQYDVWILSAPSVRNPNCYQEKRIWVEKHFDYELAKRLILCTNKGLLKGDFMIDDHSEGKGQEVFDGELILFGSDLFPDWKSVLDHLV